ncbi:hypothetical protein ACTFIU_001840 [Dictyostelium citrinum]
MNNEFYQLPNNKKNLKRVHDEIDEAYLNKKNNTSIKEFSTDVTFQDYQVNQFYFNQPQQNFHSTMGKIYNPNHMHSIVVQNPSISKPQLINQNNINIQSSIPNITNYNSNNNNNNINNNNNNQNNLNVINRNPKNCLNLFF